MFNLFDFSTFALSKPRIKQQIFLTKMKSIKGTRTEQNLLKSFAGESQAHMRYVYFAKEAKKEGFEQIAAIFQETVVGSGHIPEDHVDEGDILARYPDRRDQEGNAFDDGINEHSVRSAVPKSESINDMNRYATIDNAQPRVLNPDEK